MTDVTKTRPQPQPKAPDPDRSFRVPNEIRSGDRLPAARAEVLVSAHDRKFSLDLIYIRIAEVDRAGVVRQALDDGAAIVDRNREGTVVGIEFTSLPTREELGEYLHGPEDRDGHLLWCALCTARNFWLVYERVLAALNKYHLAPSPERTARAIFDLASASPDHDRWRMPEVERGGVVRAK